MLDRDTEAEQRLFQCYSFLCEHARKVATHLCILHQSIERDNDSNISSAYRPLLHLHSHIFKSSNVALAYILQIMVAHNQIYLTVQPVKDFSPFG